MHCAGWAYTCCAFTTPQEKGINSHRSGIVSALGQKSNVLFPNLYDPMDIDPPADDTTSSSSKAEDGASHSSSSSTMSPAITTPKKKKESIASPSPATELHHQATPATTTPTSIPEGENKNSAEEGNSPMKAPAGERTN